ncbi:MAG: hypothetical protein WC595_04335 [Candidatus Nanoarchaeia archaeon]
MAIEFTSYSDDQENRWFYQKGKERVAVRHRKFDDKFSPAFELEYKEREGEQCALYEKLILEYNNTVELFLFEERDRGAKTRCISKPRLSNVPNLGRYWSEIETSNLPPEKKGLVKLLYETLKRNK